MAAALLAFAPQSPAQALPAPPTDTVPAAGFKLPQSTPNDTLVSPQVSPDGRVTFRLYAPMASTVMLSAEMLDFGQKLALEKNTQGVWSVTTAEVPAGTYRYTFLADGITLADPRNPSVSTTNNSVQSLVRVSSAASAFEDTTSVPHGAVAAIYYTSGVYHAQRRMHIYTPPGYQKGVKVYPVLYLLHGGGDADESWSTIGRAGFILDNLIAAKKALPMIVVMPAGHVPGSDGRPGNMPAMGADPQADPFTADLLKSIVPYVEANYRVSTQAQQRALAGLSMGGIQAANIGLTHADFFPYLGIFSSGWFPEVRAEFERLHGQDLDQDGARLKLLWVGYGKTDIAHDNAQSMLGLFDRHGLKYSAHESDGGHSWYNWRHYLADFAPMLFR